MAILRCYVDDRTLHILERESRVSGRSIEELAEAAIADTAIRALPPHLRMPMTAEDGAEAMDNGRNTGGKSYR